MLFFWKNRFLVFLDELVCESIRVLLCSLLLLINRSAQVMVKFVQNHKRVSEYVAVKHRDSLVLGTVAPESLCLVTFRQSHSQLRKFYLVVSCQEREGFFCFPVQNQPDDKGFEFGLQYESQQMLPLQMKKCVV